ncbi:MAG TPA: ATP-binding protein [Cytophagaceae bacterium]|jgi:AAA+ superfamily predicted ATPase|nr:ATP-binding protein [Cytophagaceae bacterium]
MYPIFSPLIKTILSQSNLFYPSDMENKFFNFNEYKNTFDSYHSSNDLFSEKYSANIHTIVSLALSAVLCNKALERLKLIRNEYAFSEFIGGVTKNAAEKFIPTVHTALFLLAGNDTAKRLELLKKYFLPGSILFRQNILKPLPADPLLEDTPLECTPEFIYQIINGGEYQYSYSTNFPATLYTTNETWEDLCLNDREMIDLMEVKAWLKNFQRLKENSLFGKSHKGYKAMFFGPPGTGKTVSVGLLGKEINMPVYRIDLSQIVSKWVGETEKNLKYIFDLASTKNWILFFDEGDALFGKRSDNTGGNDRYGNQEVAYLLQRMEEHEGIIFICTNKQHNMDEAFRRRFSSRVEFFLPKKQESLMIWQKYLPELEIELEAIDLSRMADKIKVSGASIKNFCKWMKIIQYENLHKTEEQIQQGTKISKHQFLELMSKYFSRYEGQSLDSKLFG